MSIETAELSADLVRYQESPYIKEMLGHSISEVRRQNGVNYVRPEFFFEGLLRDESVIRFFEVKGISFDLLRTEWVKVVNPQYKPSGSVDSDGENRGVFDYLNERSRKVLRYAEFRANSERRDINGIDVIWGMWMEGQEDNSSDAYKILKGANFTWEEKIAEKEKSVVFSPRQVIGAGTFLIGGGLAITGAFGGALLDIKANRDASHIYPTTIEVEEESLLERGVIIFDRNHPEAVYVDIGRLDASVQETAFDELERRASVQRLKREIKNEPFVIGPVATTKSTLLDAMTYSGVGMAAAGLGILVPLGKRKYEEALRLNNPQE